MSTGVYKNKEMVPELMYEIEDVLTLCCKCHLKTLRLTNTRVLNNYFYFLTNVYSLKII